LELKIWEDFFCLPRLVPVLPVLFRGGQTFEPWFGSGGDAAFN